MLRTYQLVGMGCVCQEVQHLKVGHKSAIMSSSTIARLDCGKRYSEATVHNKIAYCSGE